MPNASDILWFKQQFQAEIEQGVQGTPFSADMLTALACQETGEIWPILRKRSLTRDRILELCVGDTLDSNKGRKAFPQTKADLVASPNGQQMFDLARQALVDMAEHITSYQGAVSNPNKFCHGFGIFQFDIQFFPAEPDYFLQKRYADFPTCLGKAIGELRNGVRRIGWQSKTSLTDMEMACVAIAYNTGHFNAAKGLKQGFFDGHRFYGEAIAEFLRLSKTVHVDSAAGTPPPAAAPPPRKYKVSVTDTPLRVRREPSIDQHDPNANVVARLPTGQIVEAVTNNQVNGFLEVTTTLAGQPVRGFASAQFLKPV